MDTIQSQTIDFIDSPDMDENSFLVVLSDGTEIEVAEHEFYLWLRCSRFVGPWEDVDRDAGRVAFRSGEITVDDILEDSDLLKEAMQEFMEEMEVISCN